MSLRQLSLRYLKCDRLDIFLDFPLTVYQPYQIRRGGSVESEQPDRCGHEQSVGKRFAFLDDANVVVGKLEVGTRNRITRHMATATAFLLNRAASDLRAAVPIGHMTEQTAVIVKRSLLLSGPVRIMASSAADPGVIWIVTRTHSQPIGLETHGCYTVKTCPLYVQPGPVTASAEIDDFIRNPALWIVKRGVGRAPRDGIQVRGPGPMATLTSYARLQCRERKFGSIDCCRRMATKAAHYVFFTQPTAQRFFKGIGSRFVSNREIQTGDFSVIANSAFVILLVKPIEQGLSSRS